MQLLLISNSTQYGSGYLDHCEGAIRQILSGLERVVFIPFALHDWDGYSGRARKRFAALGLQLRGIHQEEGPLANLAWADAIFSGGGNTFRLLKQLYEFDLLTAIREKVGEGAPYLGASAGTNIACASIRTTNDMPIVYPPSFDALSLVPFNINPHYLDANPGSTHQGETREERIREFHEENSNPVVGLREGAWLHRVGDQLHLSGRNGARLFQRDAAPRELASGEDVSFLLKSFSS